MDVMGAGAILLGFRVARLALRLTGNSEMADAADDLSDVLSGISGAFERTRVENELKLVAVSVVENLDTYIRAEYRELSQDDVDAVLDAVGATLAASLDTETLVRNRLDPIRIVEDLKRNESGTRRSQLGSGERMSLYDIVLNRCVNYAVSIANKYPKLSIEALRQLLEANDQVAEDIAALLASLEARTSDALASASEAARHFEHQYCQVTGIRNDQLRIFGLDAAETIKQYPLTTAYVSLRSVRDTESVERPATSVHSALGSKKRILIRGEAGSGKTTVLQWAATRLAQDDLPQSMDDWKGRIPFVLRLRKYVDKPFPGPTEFVTDSSEAFPDIAPPGWVKTVLEAGRAVLLIDGLDELPSTKRPDFTAWLRSLKEVYPGSIFVVTTRPSAITQRDAILDDFLLVDLIPMEPVEIRQFIRRWHAAIERSDDTVSDAAVRLSERILTSPDLRLLAGSPLLCAVLCTLNRSRSERLPHSRISVYNEALAMLLARRDAERGMNMATADDLGLGIDEQLVILDEVGRWFIANGHSEAAWEDVSARVARASKSLPSVSDDSDEVLKFLVDRSGVLREPILGQIDFIHRTFAEYFAARAFVALDDWAALARRFEEPDWHEVIALAAGYGTPAFRKALTSEIRQLASDAEPHAERQATFLALKCAESGVTRDEDLWATLSESVAALIPPRSTDDEAALVGTGALPVSYLVEAMRSESLSDGDALACLRVLARIATPECLVAMSTVRQSLLVHGIEILEDAWSRFPPKAFAQEVLGTLRDTESIRLRVTDIALAPFTRLVPENVALIGDFSLAELARLPLSLSGSRFETLRIRASSSYSRPVTAGEVLSQVDGLRYIDMPIGVGEDDLSKTHSLESLTLRGGDLDAAVLHHLPNLRRLKVVGSARLVRPECLAAASGLESLTIKDAYGIEELPSMPAMSRLVLTGSSIVSLEWIRTFESLEELNISGSVDLLDISGLAAIEGLRELDVSESSRLRSIGVVDDLPMLESVVASGCSSVFEVGELLDRPDVTVDISQTSVEIEADSYGVSLDQELTRVQDWRHDHFLSRIAEESLDEPIELGTIGQDKTEFDGPGWLILDDVDEWTRRLNDAIDDYDEWTHLRSDTRIRDD